MEEMDDADGGAFGAVSRQKPGRKTHADHFMRHQTVKIRTTNYDGELEMVVRLLPAMPPSGSLALSAMWRSWR